MAQKRYSSEYKALQPFVIEDIRRVLGGSEGAGSADGGGGALGVHVLATTSALGAEHTVSGLTAGQVLRATGSTTARFMALSHDDLTGVTPNQHHAQVHDIVGPDHTVTGSQWQIVGLTAANTLGMLTPSADVRSGAAEALLKSDSSGALGVKGLTVGAAMTLAGTNNIATAPDIQFASNGLLAAESSMYFGVDSTNTGTGYAFIFGHNAATSAFTELLRINDAGKLIFTAAVPTISTTANDLTIDPASRTLFADDKQMRSQTHTAGFLGAGWSISWPLSGKAHLDIRSAYMEELEVTAFQADVMRVRVAEDFLTQSMGFTAEPFTTPAISGTVRVYFENNPAFAGQIFIDNEWVMFQVIEHGTGLLVKQVWGQVSSYIDEGNDRQSWLYTMRSGPVGLRVNKNTTALSFGASGSGYIHHSVLRSAGGPWTRYATWSGANPYTPANRRVHAQAGNLNGLVDIATDRYGIAAGNNLGSVPSAGFSGFVADDTGGLRLFNTSVALYTGATQTVSIAQTGGVKLGSDISAAGTTTFDFTAASGILRIGPGGGAGASLYWSGAALALRNSAADNVIVLDSSGGSYFAGVMTIGTAGEIRQGTGTLGSNYTGLRIWRDTNVGRIGGYKSDVLQWYADTAGEMRAGAGLVAMAADGYGMARYATEVGTPISGTESRAALAWWDNIDSRTGSPLARIYAGRSDAGTGAVPSLSLEVDPGNATAGKRGSVWLTGTHPGYGNAPSLQLVNVYTIVGIPGIYPRRTYGTTNDAVDFSGTLTFQAHLLRDSGNTAIDIGTAGNPFRTLYATNVIATSISGTAMSGQEWEYTGSMLIDATAAGNTTVTVSNSGAGRADLDVDRNITLGGTVDGVDLAAFYTAYGTHNHDSLYVPLTRTLTAGNGLTGGGTLAADRSFAVGAGTLITVGADDVGLSVGTAQYQAIVTGGSPFTPAYTALSTFAGNGMSFTGGQYVIGAGAGITVGATTVALTTPGTLAVDSANTATGNHTHAITTSSSPTDARILASDSSGGVTLQQVRLGTNMTLYSQSNIASGPDIQWTGSGILAAETSVYINADSTNTGGGVIIFSKGGNTSAATELARITNGGRLGIGNSGPLYELDVTGTARATVALRTVDVIASANVRTPSLDTASGNMTIAPAGDLALTPGGLDVTVAYAASLRSDNFSKSILTTGWSITPTSVTGQSAVLAGSAEFDELRARIFVADETRVDRGQLYLTKSYGILSRAFTVPASVGGTANIFFENSPHIAGALFSANDWIMLAYLDMSGGIVLTKVWGQVNTYTTSGLTGEQRWTFTLRSGTGGLEFAKGSLGIDFGASGAGFILLDAVTATSPYMQVGRWTTNPYTPANYQVLTQIGNLAGVGFTGEYGLAASVNGYGADAPWIKVSTTGAQLNNLPLIWTDSGTTKGYIGAWNDIWFGPSASDKRLYWDGTTAGIVGTITATAGKIANWNIGVLNANTISGTVEGDGKTYIRLISGASGTARLEVGDTVTAGRGAGIVSRSSAAGIALWAGEPFSSIASAPFRVTMAGALYASSADITGSIKATTGYIGGTSDGWSIGSGLLSSIGIRLYSGGAYTSRLELGDGTAANTAGVRAGGAFTAGDTAFWAGSAHDNTSAATFRVTLGGALYATSGAIGGWTLGASSLTSTGIGLYSGAAGTARLQVGSGGSGAGIISPASGSDVAIWAGADYTGRGSAKFMVQADGTLWADTAVLTRAAISNTDVSSIYAGNRAVKLSTEGQRMLLPTETGVEVALHSSAVRWLPNIETTYAANNKNFNYVGFIGYKNTTVGAVDMLLTSFVGSTDAGSLAARFVLQAGHQTVANDAGTYTDTRLEVVREAGSGAKYIGVYADRMEMNGSMRLMTLSDTPAIGGSGESAHIYCKAGKIVIAYNNGGTIRYKTLTLSTTATTWQDSTTAP